MSDADVGQDDADRTSRIPLIVTIVSVVVMGAMWLLSMTAPGQATSCMFLLAQVAVVSLVIWQACDPFADAAQWIGIQLRIPGSVRGATLDAVASSMPELFTGVFFVIIAVGSSTLGQEERVQQAGDGYGSAIATCAGSAVYNMILIPAFCGLVISYTRKKRPTIDVDPEVISRDGIWFLGTSLLLILFLFQDRMHWWMGVALLALYCVYVVQLYRDARRFQKAHDAVKSHFDKAGKEHNAEEIAAVLRADGIWATPLLVGQIRSSLDKNDDDEEVNSDTAGLLFGFFELRLSHLTAWLIILAATLVAAVSCYWLVEITIHIAEVLQVEPFFVAVIITAAASSVPDTFLSIGAARRGDDSGAVSNAFGSNIFDICICLSVPLLVSSYLLGWQPIGLTQNGKPMAGLVDLRVLLVFLTFVTLLIMWHQRQLTRGKSLVLCGLYGVFLAYAILGSLGYTIFQ